MTDDYLYFFAHVDTDLSLAHLIDHLICNLPGTVPQTSVLLRWQDNILDVDENNDFDPLQTSDPHEGWFYYRYRIEAFPVEDHVTLEQQVQIARAVRDVLLKLTDKVQVGANFEDLL